MPFATIKLNPGINTQATQSLNEAGWSLSNLIRWKAGYLERIGGWKRLFATPCAAVVRALHAYEDLNLVNTLMIGTDAGVQFYANGTLASSSFARGTHYLTSGSFLSTTTGSSVVTVTDPGHSASAGDTIMLPMPYSIASANVYFPAGSYTIASVIDSNTYTINLPLGQVAAQTTSGGAQPQYQIAAGSSVVRAFVTAFGPVQVGDTYTVHLATVFPGGNVTLVGPYTVTGVTGSYITFDCGTVATLPTGANTQNAFEGANVAGQASPPPAGGIPWNKATGIVTYSGRAPSIPQNWFLDNLGQNGVVCYTNGPIYIYSPPFSTSAVLNSVPTAPQINAGAFVAMPQAQIIAFGSEATIGGGVQDPLLVRWCNVGDYTNWIAGGNTASQAGSLRLSKGSRIIGGIQAPQSGLLWTDTDVWSMVYTGGSNVYSFTVVGSGCGLIAPKARAIQGRNTFWMGQKSFWTYGDNGVQPLECPVWDQVFPLLDVANARKCFAASNSSFHEVTFYFPVIGGSGECQAYVKLNTLTGLWDYGMLTRTAWIDESVFGSAMGVDGNMRIQQHEVGYDADDQPMAGAFAQSGYASMSDGSQFTFLDRLIPDLKWLGSGGAINVTIFTADHPGDVPRMHGPYSVTATTPEVPFRARARLMSVRFDWMPSAGYSARLGAPRIRSAPAGRV